MNKNNYHKKQEMFDFSTQQVNIMKVETLVCFVGDESIDKVKLFENKQFKKVFNKYFIYLCDHLEKKYIISFLQHIV